MATDVPTTNDLKGSVTENAVPGIGLAIGENFGRSILGPGFGTAAGGIAAAATQSGTDRQVMAIRAFEQATNELMAGGGGGRGRQGVK